METLGSVQGLKLMMFWVLASALHPKPLTSKS